MDGVPPADFTIDRDCELKAADEMKSVVKYGRHNLDTDELRGHLVSGKMPTRLAMTWKERISFTLTDTLQVKGIKFLDVVFDGRDKPAKDEAFDADASLATGELSQLIPALIEALGGELDFLNGLSLDKRSDEPASGGELSEQGRLDPVMEAQLCRIGNLDDESVNRVVVSAHAVSNEGLATAGHLSPPNLNQIDRVDRPGVKVGKAAEFGDGGGQLKSPSEEVGPSMQPKAHECALYRGHQ